MLKRALLFTFLLVLIITINAFLNPIPGANTIEGFKPSYGVSYSFEQAAWYSLEPRRAYIDLLDQVHPNWVRLPFFWNEMVDESGNFNQNFADLKWAISEAGRRNVKVVVALGAKTPYYPEYHWPDYVAAKVEFGQKIDINSDAAQDILRIDRKVVYELENFDNIAYWQVENEPYLANVNNWKIDKDLVGAEVEAVRSADSGKRSIILNHVAPAIFDWRYKSLLSILKSGDVFGVNAYFKTQGTYLFSFKILEKEVRINWPVWLVWPVQSWIGFSPNFASLKKQAREKGIELWVLEMQAEPYIRVLSDANKQKYSYDTADILAAESYLRSFKIESVGLWGAHFWQYRHESGDDSWIKAIGQITGN